MRPVQPQQLQSQTRGEAVSLGKAPSPAPAHLPVSGVKDLALFPQKYGKIIPSYRGRNGRSGMSCGRLTASPEQSWRWNLGMPESQLHPSSSPALCQNMDKAFREGKPASPCPWNVLSFHGQGCIPQFSSTEKWNVLEDLEHTGNLQDKTSNHRKLSVPIQTKNKERKKKKRSIQSHSKMPFQEFHLPHLMEFIHTWFYL